MGTCTVAIKKRSVAGAQKTRVVDITLSNSYATGGDTVTLASLDLALAVDLLVASPKSGLVFEYDHANNKLKAFLTTGGAGTPAAGATPAASGVGAAGATAVTSSAATVPVTVNPGVGVEVPAARDLSSITVRAIVFGDNPYI